GAAALALGRGVPARAQDATAEAIATATAEAAGVQVSTAVPGKVNVAWWTHNNIAFVAANKEMIARFQKQRPDVNIVYQYFPYDVFISKLQAGYASNAISDMQQMFGTWVTEYARYGLLDQVPDKLAAGYNDRFWPAARGAYVYQDKPYGMPNEYNLENGGMLYNPGIMTAAGIKAPPKTWQELVDDAVKTAKHDDSGKLTQAGFQMTGNDQITFLLLSMILQQGATYWADDGVHVNFQTDAAKKGWQDEIDLVKKYKVDDETSYTGDRYIFFFQGKAAMSMVGPWAIPVGEQEFPGLKFDYVAMPPYAGDEMKFAAESGWGEVVNAKSADDVKQAAWDFIDFFHQPDNLRDWNIMTYTIPSLQALKDDPTILKKAPAMKVPFSVLAGGQWVGPVGDRDKFWQSIHDAYTAACLGQLDPATALTQAEQEINAMIDERVGP
ncbi:MAG TPA: extracellular solute-binding protein, partial [Thermomicrobiales bacterium]|nr:extracellular solute-binding protein [Thermomicrobiales bacterium]